ncbi:MAG: rhodanese-like domain-containing protein, partial [Paracoccaceae bacterium]|nr:rhodanese-like domain-containing protein [Paracoccaceae bacterium]
MKRRTILRQGLALAALGTLPFGFAPMARAAGDKPAPLVDADWLRGRLGQDDLVVIDIRGSDVTEAFTLGHLPGAVWAPYPGGWAGSGDIPGAVPPLDGLQAQIAGLGVNADSTVIVVAAGTNAVDFGGAARVYWTLKFAGVDRAAILDGGYDAWAAAAQNPVETGLTSPRPGNFQLAVDSSILSTTAQVEANLSGPALLIDARSSASYVGEKKSLAAKRGGHIPGAINHSSSLFWDETANRLKKPDAIPAVLPAGLTAKDMPVITYCDAGHVSATQWFVLHELMGFK